MLEQPTILNQYLKDEIEVFYILTGHDRIEMTVTRLHMKIVIAAFGEDFVKAYSFKSNKAIKYPLSYKRNQKCLRFIHIYNAVMYVEMANKFFLREFEKG